MSEEKNGMELCEALWNECEANIRRMCNRRLSSYPSEIDDVIAEAYLILCNAIDKDADLRDPKSWLYGVVNNLIKLKYTEINKRKRNIVNLDNIDCDLSYMIDFCDVNINESMIDEISEELFDSLLESEKTLWILVYEQKLKFKEIAKILNTTEAAVKQKHYRLKAKLKQSAKEKIKNFE